MLIEPLTPREQEICNLTVLGWSSTRIAKFCEISDRTVHAHREKIFEKYGVHGAIELIREIYNLDRVELPYKDVYLPPWRKIPNVSDKTNFNHIPHRRRK